MGGKNVTEIDPAEPIVHLVWEGPFPVPDPSAENTLPDRPGVYAWVLPHPGLDRIYIGKADSIRKRLREHRRNTLKGDYLAFGESNLAKDSESADFNPAQSRRRAEHDQLFAENVRRARVWYAVLASDCQLAKEQVEGVMRDWIKSSYRIDAAFWLWTARAPAGANCRVTMTAATETSDTCWRRISPERRVSFRWHDRRIEE